LLYRDRNSDALRLLNKGQATKPGPEAAAGLFKGTAALAAAKRLLFATSKCRKPDVTFILQQMNMRKDCQIWLSPASMIAAGCSRSRAARFSSYSVVL